LLSSTQTDCPAKGKRHKICSRNWKVWIYAGLGDADKAFEWLKKCYQERDSWMWFFEHQSEFDLIRHDSRFREMLERLNLE
jgi:hypothetical protein